MDKALWKDFTLNPNPRAAGTNPQNNLILQDFLTPAATPAWPSPPENPSHLLCTTTPSFLSSLNSPFEALASDASLNPFPTKRRPEVDTECSGDRRYKRMMKNRESAARSRARRMAYTFELERERAQLMEENARLRRDIAEQELYSAVEEAPKSRNISRSLSAPF